MTAKVAGFKLVNNMDIIAKVVSRLDDRYEVESPRIVLMSQSEGSQEIGIDFVPVSPLMDTGIKTIQFIHFSSIIVPEYKVNPQVEAAYLQHVSGIALPAANGGFGGLVSIK